MYNRFNRKAPHKRRALELLVVFSVSFAIVVGIAGCTKEEIPVPEDLGHTKAAPASPQVLVSDLGATVGSTVGPDGYLYVTEGSEGKIYRIDPHTGDYETFASGLPAFNPEVGFGGPVDVCFRDGKAYALVTLVGSDEVGIFEIDGNGPGNHKIIAYIGQYNISNPAPGIFVPTGVQYAIETYRKGFLVTDGHMNRVFYVTPDGDISIVRSFGNIVPTGLDVSGNKVYMAEAGPTPHLPEDGKLISFVPASPHNKSVASGAPLLVDVEFGFAHRLYALAQGEWAGEGPGTPAKVGTGSLVQANPDGTFAPIVEELNLPSSLEFIGNTAYIVSLAGEVVTVENVKGNVPF